MSPGAARVFVIGTADAAQEALRRALAARGHEVVETAVGDAPTDPEVPEAIVLATGEGALECCRSLTERMPGVAVIVVDETPDLARAISALRFGAADYTPHAADVLAVDIAIRRVAEQRMLRDRLTRLERETSASSSSDEPRLLGESDAIQRVRERIERVGGSDATVLITGASGTGKEVVARALHRSGGRRDGPFVAVNCGAVPADLVESEFFGHSRGAFTDAGAARAGLLVEASGGTLFLDEAGAMPLPAQAKLLRAIQERRVRPVGQGREVPFDARIVAATDVSLSGLVARGEFRQDLFFRLNVVPIRIPPLREREYDTLLLAQHFLRRFAALSGKGVVGMTPGAARLLLSYDWPGNVRELSNWMEAAVALSRRSHVTEAELLSNVHRQPTAARAAEEPSGPPPSPEGLGCWDDLEARHITTVLEEVGGNKARAARLLGIDRKTLYRKLRRYGLPIDDGATGTPRT